MDNLAIDNFDTDTHIVQYYNRWVSHQVGTRVVWAPPGTESASVTIALLREYPLINAAEIPDYTSHYLPTYPPVREPRHAKLTYMSTVR
jgi:hypothetical protein